MYVCLAGARVLTQAVVSFPERRLQTLTIGNPTNDKDTSVFDLLPGTRGECRQAHADRFTASADDCIDLNCTDGCGSCGATVCSCSESVCEQAYLFPQSDGGVNLRGWVAAGFIGNMSDPESRFNGPYNAVDRSNELMLNQFYLIGERALPNAAGAWVVAWT